jgi:hypothetical protein
MNVVTTQWLVVCLVVSGPVSASAGRAQSPEEMIEELNREAMEAYNQLELSRADSMLQEALRVADLGGVSAALLARTRINLGVIHVGALGDAQGGFGFFVAALCGDPSVQLDPLTSTPDMQRVFQAARERALAGSCPAQQPVSVPARPPQPPGPVERPEVPPPIEPHWLPAPRKEAARLRRFFFQVGFNSGFALVQDGMPADRGPLCCVRVEPPGFVPTVGARFALGYFLGERFSLALPVRVQFSAGEGGALKNLQLGLRGEWQWLRPKPTGLMLSNFVGFTVGELRARPPVDWDGPFVVSGPAGAHLGLYLLRYRFHPNLGLYSAAELDFQFPKFLFNVDWTPIGLELAL